MKRLHLLRHGKATHKFLAIDDFDRPLTEKGILESYGNARTLYAGHKVPQRIISSSAARALATAVIFRKVLGLTENALEVTDLLYEISYSDLIGFISGLDDGFADVMLVGHNPSFSMLSEEVSVHHAHIPTGGVVGFSSSISKWNEFSPALADVEYTIGC
jgi:phosphohistidine phosphatase